jgi:hypothetical protein
MLDQKGMERNLWIQHPHWGRNLVNSTNVNYIFDVRNWKSTVLRQPLGTKLQNQITKQNFQTKLPNWITKQNCQTETEPKLITDLNCQTEELPNRNAKLNCQLELPNWIAKRTCQIVILNSFCQTELPKWIAELNYLTELSNWIHFAKLNCQTELPNWQIEFVLPITWFGSLVWQFCLAFQFGNSVT